MISSDDFKTIIAGLQTAYPRYEIVTNSSAFKLWYASLCDLDETALKRAAKQHIMCSPFPPSISELRQRAYDLTADPATSAAVAWDTLMRALSGANSPDSIETWESLPTITKELVGGFRTFRAWSNVPVDQLETVQRPMFIKKYDAVMLRTRQQSATPAPLRNPARSIEGSTMQMIEERDYSEHEKLPMPPELKNKLLARLRGTA